MIQRKERMRRTLLKEIPDARDSYMGYTHEIAKGTYKGMNEEASAL